MDKNELIQTNNIVTIENKIFVFRGQQVMIDRDLAELYNVETKRINEQVKRNFERFPEDFYFQLSNSEFENWRSQFATSNSDKMGLRRPPYVFTEQGVAMLSTVLHSETAIKVSIQIMKAFVAMRKFLSDNAQVFNRLDRIETHQLESDKKIEELFTKMETYGVERRQGIFFQGQIFDSYAFVEKLIQNAKKEIILIDGYIDLTVLERFSKKKKNVNVTIYTHPKTPLSNLDVQKFNAQYPTLTLKTTTKIHDRFLIIDNRELYHLGASLKDLGAKCFAFEKMEDEKILIPELLKNV